VKRPRRELSDELFFEWNHDGSGEVTDADHLDFMRLTKPELKELWLILEEEFS
jgi:hypothetical protein